MLRQSRQSEGYEVKRLIPAALAGTLAAGVLLGLGSAVSAAGTAGNLDSTFGKGGVVLTDLGVDAGGAQFQGTPSTAVLLPNGDIVVAGSFGLVRYLPNGTLDPAFGTGGFAQAPPQSLDYFPPGLAVQPDGKYLLAGGTTSPNGTSSAFGVVRFNVNGSVDQTFGSGGEVKATFPNSNVQGASTLLVAPDGKILVGGESLLNTYHAPAVGALARFNPDGTLDQSFGAGGQVTAASTGPISALGLDAGGDIFVLPAHAEFSPAGQLDSAVTPSSITVGSHGGSEFFLPSGQFVIGNSVGVAKHDTDVQLRRFNADGSVAASSPVFDYSGASGLDQARDGIGAVAVEPNGQTVVAGAHFLSTSPVAAARLNADGSLDTAFGNGGTVITTPQGNEAASAVLVQPDGKIIAVGYSENNSTGIADVALVRYLGR
jgi:uncharacterized delta-60 repeat protein